MRPEDGLPQDNLHKGNFRLWLRPDGSVSLMDLPRAFRGVVERLGGGEELWARRPCPARAADDVPFAGDPRVRLAERVRAAWRLADPCRLCPRRCGAARLSGGRGFCGLGRGVSVAGYTMLYGEDAFAGQPSFGVYLRGCALRCRFCYRPDERAPAAGREDGTLPAEELAALLDRAAEAGAVSWHFLGGNPDQSVPGVLEALLAARRRLPVVWNNALMLEPEALALLRGVVDVWLADYKFGSDACAERLAGLTGYGAVARRNLLALAGEPWLAVRHMRIPGHEDCCRRPVLDWLAKHLPRAAVREFGQVATGP